MVAGVFDRIRDVLSGGDGPAGGPLGFLQPIDTAKIAQKLDLQRKGCESGRRELPPTDAATFDDGELSIIQLIESEWRLKSGALIDELRSYAKRLISFSIDAELKRLVLKADDALTQLRAAHYTAGQELDHLRDRFGETRAEFDAFRARHLLSRPARNPTGRWTTIGLLVVLVALESVLNGFFFAAGAKHGLIGGIGTAVGISIVNVVLAFLVGLVPVRWINHRNWLVKLLGVVFTVGGSAALFALHAFAAHLRDASTALLPPAEAMNLALQTLFSAPWILTDITSYYLFALGCLCAGITIWKGYTFDDPYPNFGRQSRRLEAVRAAYSVEHSELFDRLDDIKDETIRDIDSGIERIPRYPQEAAAIRAERTALLGSFKTYEGSVETAVNHLLATYRAANRACRSTLTPPHFDQLWSLPAAALEDSETKKALAEPAEPESSIQSILETLRSKSAEVLGEYERLLVKYPHASNIAKA